MTTRNSLRPLVGRSFPYLCLALLLIAAAFLINSPRKVEAANGMAFTATPSGGTVVKVTTTDDNNSPVITAGHAGTEADPFLAPSLRSAISFANSNPGGATITFGVNGTITLTSGELTIEQDLTISGPGENLLTISGNSASRVFTINSGVTATISGLTLTNGNVSNPGSSTNEGAAIFNSGTLTLTNCTLSNNLASGGSNSTDQGAAIWNSGAVTITNCTLSGNSVTDGGSTATVEGGAIYNQSGATLAITNSTISNNSSIASGGSNPPGKGGAIFNDGTLTITNSTLSDNSAIGASGPSAAQGGAILNNGAATIIGSLLSNNSVSGGGSGSTKQGGAIWNNGSGTLTITNSTLSGNSATGGGTSSTVEGGAIWNNGAVTLTNSTLSGNSITGSGPSSGSTVQGGGIWNGGTVSARNTIVAKNTAAAGSTAGPGPNIFGTFTSLGHNLIGDSSDATVTAATGDQLGSSASPIDPKLGPLQNNGGPTETMTLLQGSTAIDAGDDCVLDNTCSPALGLSLSTDQRGYARKVGAHVDIGAVELQSSLVVTNTNDSGVGSLRDAIAGTNSGGAIVFSNSTANGATNFFDGTQHTITLTSEQLTIDKDVTITGPGENLLTISGNSASRIFQINSGVNVSISNLTLTNGKLAGGGNSTNQGGSIWNGGTLTITGCTLSNNSASGGGDSVNQGGAIYNQSGATLSITNSTLSGNFISNGGATATDEGGAIYNQSGATLSITNSTLSNNNSTSSGGGIPPSKGGAIFNNGTLSITGSTLSGNSAIGGSGPTTAQGGAILNNGAATITNSTLSGNSISGGGSGTNMQGGAIYNSGSATLSITNSTLSGNSATNLGASGTIEGGAIWTSGLVTITNATISGNSITGSGPSSGTIVQGGGIWNGGTLSARNTIVAKNTAAAGRTSAPGPDIFGTLTSQGHNLIGDSSDATVTPASDDQVGTSASPIDPKLDTLHDNGGPTQTMALLPASPAIDAGDDCVFDNSCSPALGSALTTDQRGSGFSRKSRAHVDIGAFEVQNQPPVASCKGITVSADSSCSATISVADIDNGSSDSDLGDSITLSFNPSSVVNSTTLSGTGEHTLTLYVTDSFGVQTSCTSIVTVKDTTPPTINAPLPTTASADANCQAAVPNVLAQTTSSDSCSAVQLEQSPAAGTLVGLGPHTITITATDAAGNHNQATTTFTVNDTTPPSLSVPGPLSVAAGANSLAAIPNVVTGSIASDCDGPVTITQSPAAGTLVGLGPHTITVTAKDAAGNKREATTTFTVRDTTPPVISGASASPNVIWPPNNKMVDVFISYSASDNSGIVNTTLSISSNEPAAAADMVVVDSHHVRLKADRLGSGHGRIYTIWIKATDQSGNSSQRSVTVTVPHDQGK